MNVQAISMSNTKYLQNNNQPAFTGFKETAVSEGAKAGVAYIAHKLTGASMTESYAWSKEIGDIVEIAGKFLVIKLVQKIPTKFLMKKIPVPKAGKQLSREESSEQNRIMTHNLMNKYRHNTIKDLTNIDILKLIKKSNPLNILGWFL